MKIHSHKTYFASCKNIPIIPPSRVEKLCSRHIQDHLVARPELNAPPNSQSHVIPDVFVLPYLCTYPVFCPIYFCFWPVGAFIGMRAGLLNRKFGIQNSLQLVHLWQIMFSSHNVVAQIARSCVSCGTPFKVAVK